MNADMKFVLSAFISVHLRLISIVKDHPKRIAFPRQHRTHPMPEVCPIVASRTFHRPIARRDDHCLALFQSNGVANRLRARLLFH